MSVTSVLDELRLGTECVTMFWHVATGPRKIPFIMIEHGSKVDMKSRVTMEYVILNQKTQGEDLTQVKFGLHSNSRSLVIDRFGNVSGLYYGNAS